MVHLSVLCVQTKTSGNSDRKVVLQTPGLRQPKPSSRVDLIYPPQVCAWAVPAKGLSPSSEGLLGLSECTGHRGKEPVETRETEEHAHLLALMSLNWPSGSVL